MGRASAKTTESHRRLVASRVLREGDVVDDTYRVAGLIAAGGMGEVYEVVHTRLERAFALKCLRAETLGDQKATKRFLREVRSLAAVRSEHVVSIVDCGELADGAPYLVMERLQGQNLRELLKANGSLVPRRAVALISDACLGLTAVHESGLIHRDLKPENLFVTRRDSGEEACKVLDFGIATRPGNNSTRRDSLLGTLRYMAPEQIADSSRVGTWTDVYALGAILYECLCGHPPHEADTETELMFKIMNADVEPLASRVEGFPVPLSRVVARALSRDVSERYQTVEQLSRALASFRPGGHAGSTDEGAETRPIGGAPSRARRRFPAFAAVLGATAAASFTLGWFVSSVHQRDGTRHGLSATFTPSPPLSAPSLPAKAAEGPFVGPTTRWVSSGANLKEASSPVVSAAERPAPPPSANQRRRPAAATKRELAVKAGLPRLDPSPYQTSP